MHRVKRYLARRLKLHHFRVIAAIDSKGSLLKASAGLGLTQPAITRALHEVEMIIGARLFERHAKGVTANKLGKLMCETARRVLGDLEKFEREIDREIDSGEDLLLVGALPAAAVGILPSALDRLLQTHPEIRVHVTQGQTGEMLESLAAGEVDFVIGRLYHPNAPDAFERIDLYHDTVTVLAGAQHSIFRDSTFAIENLNRYPLALHTATPYAATELEELIQCLNLNTTACFEANSLPLIKEMLLRSEMITILPRLMLAGDISRGDIREVTSLPLAGGRLCGLILRRDFELSKSAALFIDIIRDEVAALENFSPPSAIQTTHSVRPKTDITTA